MKRLALVTLFTTVLVGCQDAQEPVGLTGDTPQFHLQVGGGDTLIANPVIGLVKGKGHFTTGEELRRFSFSALKRADGTVTGQWGATNEALGLRGRGAITCFTIVGNAAWIGGPIEAFPSDPGRVGLDAVWRVVDNGHGAHAAPDQISRFFPEAPGGASIHCLNTPNLGLNDVEAGDIQVRER